ncbi:MAG: hypothetical protein ACOY46_04940 [Bacillota bacterium]
MIALFSKALADDINKRLVAYEQGIMDVTAYNAALLAASSPSGLPLPADCKTAAVQNFNNARSSANKWMEVIVKHCRTIPETISGYDFQFKMNVKMISQSLDELSANPNDAEVKTALKKTLDGMCAVMDLYIRDIKQNTDQINQYYSNAKINGVAFDKTLKDAVDQVARDKEKVKEIQANIKKATDALNVASLRVKGDELLLGSTAYIILCTFMLGIPLLFTALDLNFAKSHVSQEKDLLDAYNSQLDAENKAIASLSLAQTIYGQLCQRIDSLLKSSSSVTLIWQNFKDECAAFAREITDLEKEVSAEEIKEAIAAVEAMQDNWKRVKSLSDVLKDVKYNIIRLNDNAA